MTRFVKLAILTLSKEVKEKFRKDLTIMSRNFNRRQNDRLIQKNLNNLQGRSVRDLDLDSYDDYEEYERFIPHEPRRFQHNVDDD